MISYMVGRAVLPSSWPRYCWPWPGALGPGRGVLIFALLGTIPVSLVPPSYVPLSLPGVVADPATDSGADTVTDRVPGSDSVAVTAPAPAPRPNPVSGRDRGGDRASDPDTRTAGVTDPGWARARSQSRTR